MNLFLSYLVLGGGLLLALLFWRLAAKLWRADSIEGKNGINSGNRSWHIRRDQHRPDRYVPFGLDTGVMTYKLGKRPARPGSVQMNFAAYFNAAKLPMPPLVFGQPWLAEPQGSYANRAVGDCVIAAGVNGTRILRAESGLPQAKFNTPDVLADYSGALVLAGRAAYIASDPATDTGLDLQEGAHYRQKVGLLDSTLVRHKIGLYCALRVGDVAEMALACWLFGACDIGVRLPANAERQFRYGETWSAPQGYMGGHAVELVGRNSKGNLLFFSWGRLQAATPQWVVQTMDEGIVYVSQERLDARGISPEGYDMAKLLDDFRQLTGSAA